MAKTYAYAIAGGLHRDLHRLAGAERAAAAGAASARPRRSSCARCAGSISRWCEFALANRIVTLGAAALLLVVAGARRRASLGLEFLPKLEEGNLWIRATMPTSISLEEGNGYVNRMRRIIKSFPEVETVVSQHGRPDDGTDATGFFNAEFFVPLKPFDTWPPGVDKDKLTEQMTDALRGAIPRRRLQLLAVHRGQRRGGRLRASRARTR